MLRHGETDDPTSILARGQYIVDEFDKSKAVDFVLQPGEPNGYYHGEAGQEDFLVVSGENVVLVSAFATAVFGWLAGQDAFAPRADHLFHLITSAILTNRPSSDVKKETY